MGLASVTLSPIETEWLHGVLLVMQGRLAETGDVSPSLESILAKIETAKHGRGPIDVAHA